MSEAGGGFATSGAPEIAGPGWISTVGDVWLKTTNIGVLGNPFTTVSSDPAAQWPGASGIEYLYYVGLWVGAKDPQSADPNRLRRVSQNTEWRPPTLEPVDRIYESREGAAGGTRLVDDDGDGFIDEDRLDGHDNDGDGLVDEDYAAVSQQMLSCVLRDDTPEAQQVASLEAHLPLGLEIYQSTYAFSLEGQRAYTAVEWTLTNVTDHVLDSVYVAFFVDQDVGPAGDARHYLDDLIEPRVPQGPLPSWPLPSNPLDDPENPNHLFVEFVPPTDPRYQAMARCPPETGFCPCEQDVIPLHGFTLVDDDGDDGRSPGASTFLLLDHTIDGRGLRAPQSVGFRMFDYFRPGVPYSQGGQPTNDQERYQLIASRRNVQGGRITAQPAREPDDYVAICSVGPFQSLAPGDSVQVTWALAAAPIDYTADPNDLPRRYKAVYENAMEAQRNFRGVYEIRPGFPVPDSAQWGRETPVTAPIDGPGITLSDCRDFETERFVQPGKTLWFDLDCNICTGPPGYYLRRWLLRSAPPVLPTVERVPGDRRVTVRWDNRSEYTPDPGTNLFDTKGYTLWRATGWTRDQGSIGPRDDEWALMATYFLYDAENPLVEQVFDPDSGRIVTVETAGVLVNRAWQPGNPFPARLYANPVPCAEAAPGVCDTTFAKKPSKKQGTTLDNYPVAHYETGYYEFVDRPVQNGFVYFYVVIPFDSTGVGANRMSELARRAAREAEAVVPQSGFASASGPYVVPNPYRGGAPWDLTPTPTDPTGTHVDFVRLPPGWDRVRIFTVSGDLVQELRPDDLQVNGRPQRETPDDGQASWNLVSRNGQEVVSGIYLFSVEGPRGTQQGKFVIIR